MHTARKQQCLWFSFFLSLFIYLYRIVTFSLDRIEYWRIESHSVTHFIIAFRALHDPSSWLVYLIKCTKQLSQGEIPTRALLKSGIWIVAGILFFIPGFLTDLIALFLLIPITSLWIEN